MMKVFLSIVISICFLWMPCGLRAQNAISGKLFGIGIHPVDNDNAGIYETAIDDKGTYLFEPGFIAAFENFSPNDRMSVKINQGIHRDAAKKIAGFTHLGIRAYVVSGKRHSLCLGVGPTFYYRQSWHLLEGYVDQEIYDGNDNWQYKFSILSGEIEYNYYMAKHTDLAISLTQMQPKAFTLAVGLRYWLPVKNSRYRKRRRRGGCDCPSFQ